MTAQPSSQAEREDVAREVLAEVDSAWEPSQGQRWYSEPAAIAAMLAFSNREHATPRSMPEEVVDRSLVAMHRRSRRSHGDVAPAVDWTPSKNAVGAYRVGHSEPPHLADGMTASVSMGDGAFSTISNPQSYDTGGIVWHLTYAVDVLPYVLTAGSIIMSFDYLLSGCINSKEAARRLRLMRAARKALTTGASA